jgi:hypothetical protein
MSANSKPLRKRQAMMIDGRKPIAVKNIAARTAKAMALKPEPTGPGNQRENLSKIKTLAASRRR